MFRPKRILSVFVVIALLAGLFVTPAFADNGSTPDLQSYLNYMGLASCKTFNGDTVWAHFDRGQLVYGFPSDVTGGTQGYDQEWKAVSESEDWETANAGDASQVLSSYTDAQDWQNGIQGGLQNSGGHPGQEPRYLGYNASGEAVSNSNFPIDASSVVAPAQCVMIEDPWANLSADPDYGDGNGGWPESYTDIDQLHWGVIHGAITNCYEQFGFTSPTDGFLYNSKFSSANGGLGYNNIMSYFELLVMPEPGSPGTIRFWHYDSDGSGPYYKDIVVTWPNGELPDYYVTSITPFSGTQEHTTTVNGQTAAVYNPDGVQYTYTGSVTFGLTGDTANATNSDEATQQLLNLMNLNNGLAPYSGEDPYYAPIAVCVNSQNNYAPISTASSTSCYPIPAGESCGGTNEGIILGDSDNQMVPGQSYTVNFTWSLPQGFSGTSMPIAAGINDGYNDIFNLTTDIIPDDVTSGYADPYEVNLSNNYTDNLNLTANNASGSTGGSTTSGNTNTNVPVVGATQPQLIVTPSSATIDVGGTQQYTDTYYPDGQLEGNGQDVTTSSTWTDNSTSIATIGSSTGLASGVGAGSTSITATYTDSNGNTLTGNASLTVQQSQKPPGTSGSYTGTLSMTAVNQATWSSTPMVTQDSQPAKKVTRPANTAKWTDQVTATLSATQEPDVSAYVPPNGVVTNVTWSIQSASISYPLKNPEFAVGNPVDPAVGATTSQDMTPSGQTATTQFLEEWSLDGVNGPGPGTGVYDILTGKVIAVNPSTWQIAASFTLTGSVSGYVPTQESNGNGGTTIVDIPFGPNQFTIQGTAEQDLTVDGAGALPQMSGDVRVIVSTD